MKKQLIKFEDILKSRIQAGEVRNEVLSSAEKLVNNINNDTLGNYDVDFYAVRVILHSLGNVLIGENKQLFETISAWKLVKYQMLLREYRLYSLALEVGNWEEFEEEISYQNGNRFINQIWALCGLYYFDEKLDWLICPVQLIKTAILRGDIDFNLKHNDEFPWLLSLVEFLYSEESRDALLEQLAEFGLFQFIQTAWHDDDLFKQGIEELCAYHIDKCSEAYKTGSFYPVEHYALFPIWIYALDKCRERELGRSVLPDNPLMSYGERVHSAPYEQVDDPILAQLADFYDSKYGSQNVDFYTFWKQFKNQQSR